MICIYYYCRRTTWKIKLLTFRMHKVINKSQQNKKQVHRLLKDIYMLLNKSIGSHDQVTAYKLIDLLKLAFGYGMMRQDESVRLMAVSVAALNKGNPDTVNFILDAFKPLIRQIAPEFVPSAAEQLTLIGAIALKKKQKFLFAKVAECIFLIMERPDATGDKKIITSVIEALKVIGVLSLRRRDIALFREISVRLSSWFNGNQVTVDITENLITMLSAWLHRIIGLNETSLFDILEESSYSLVESNVLLETKLDLLFEEWGNLAASACLNPNSQIAGRIIDVLFTLASINDDSRRWARTISIAGRVAKLAISRHGIAMAFMAFYPMLEMGRKLLWSELRFIQCIDECRQEMLFAIVRESLLIISFASKQDLVGSSGQTIVDLYKCWVENPAMAGKQKSIKKYCQLLLLFWLKDKRKVRKNLPHNNDLTEPMLFSDSERQRFRI